MADGKVAAKDCEETATIFGKQHGLSNEAIEQLRCLLCEAWQSGYECSMADELDPELSIREEINQFARILQERKPDA